MEKPFLDWMHSFEAYIQIPTGSGTWSDFSSK
jgi:hypothetical protein